MHAIETLGLGLKLQESESSLASMLGRSVEFEQEAGDAVLVVPFYHLQSLRENTPGPMGHLKAGPSCPERSRIDM